MATTPLGRPLAKRAAKMPWVWECLRRGCWRSIVNGVVWGQSMVALLLVYSLEEFIREPLNGTVAVAYGIGVLSFWGALAGAVAGLLSFAPLALMTAGSPSRQDALLHAMKSSVWATLTLSTAGCLIGGAYVAWTLRDARPSHHGVWYYIFQCALLGAALGFGAGSILGPLYGSLMATRRHRRRVKEDQTSKIQ